MSEKDDSVKTGRCDFLKFAAVSAPAVAVATASGSAVQAEQVEETGSGLRDTAHTRAYFDSITF